MPLVLDNAIVGAVGAAVSRLVSSRESGDRIGISLPLLYPSGNEVAVEVMINAEMCFVSDFGFD